MSNLKRYLVMVDDNHQNKLPQMAQKLESAGYQVDGLMEALGVISVSAQGDKSQAISNIEGVAEVTSGDEQFQAI